jgi:2,4-dienoyl-CoA reductase-like NADH-dependent reductase (Old Yellow Enzyme family)/thioredoxin reductase
MPHFEHFFAPGQIGTLSVPNRIVMPPMGTAYADADGCITDRQIAYYLERAKGGVGYITFEHTGVSPEGKASVRMAMLCSDNHVLSVRRMVDAIHSLGSRILVQINHGGRQGSSAFSGLPLVAPSAIPCPVRKETPQALSEEGIRRIVSAFAAAAARARVAGADGVEIHMAHGYLLNQFLSPLSNHRADGYGGCMDNRLRAPLEVLCAVRSAVGPDYPISCRISADEYLPGGLCRDDAQVIAQALEAHGANAIHVSACVAASGYLYQPPYYAPEGVFVPLAAAVRARVNIPVIAVGRIRTAQQADQVLRDGHADFVAMGRALIADPHLPLKVREGRLEDVIPCISCNRCVQSVREGNLQCAVNPSVGREGQGVPAPVSHRKKIWVIGGGPAGMRAATVAARRGHEVRLFEREPRLGGRFVLAAVPPEKAVLLEFVEYLIRQLRNAPVRIDLDCAFHPRVLETEHPDAVIVATGARASTPALGGQASIPVFTPDEVLSGSRPVGQRVLVLGGGGIGAEIADFLAGQGKQVTILEMRAGIALDMPSAMIHFLQVRLKDGGVEILTHTAALRWEDGALVVDGPKGVRPLGGFDAIIFSAGSRSNDDIVPAIRAHVQEVHVIGDAGKPGEMMWALSQGDEIGQTI